MNIDEYFSVPDNVNNSEIIKDHLVLGIDFGTSNSCVSVYRNNKIEIIKDKFNNFSIPSVVSYHNNMIYTGITAKNLINISPNNTIYEIKRLIGKKYSDVQKYLEYLTYNVTCDDKDNILIKINDKTCTPEEISSIILSKIKQTAEEYLKEEINDVIITIPAYFNDVQRNSIKIAAEIAELNVIRFVNEPTAASMVYKLDDRSILRELDMNVLVYDLGGGTLDVTILNISSDGIFDVLSSSGNTKLGGSDFDNRIIMYCIKKFNKKYQTNINIADITLISLQSLKKLSESAKKELSKNELVNINIPNFYNDLDLCVNLSRNKFYKICDDLFTDCLLPVQQVLSDSDLTIDDISEIVLVGGSTKMPRIKKNLKTFFKNKRFNNTINPDQVVSYGAALYGFSIKNPESLLADELTLFDKTSLSLGVETSGGIMTKIIERGSALPSKYKKIFTTDSDNMTSIKINIYEGERELCKDNFLIGNFTLNNIPANIRGYPQIEIMFHINLNGILHVTARDLNNKLNTSEITVSNNSNNLSNDDIKLLIKESRKQMENDKIIRKQKELHYKIEDMCLNIKYNFENSEMPILKFNNEMLNDILIWLETERTANEYEEMIKKIEEEYNLLTLKGNIDNLEENIDMTYGVTLFDDGEYISSKDTKFDFIGKQNNNNNNNFEQIKSSRLKLLKMCNKILENIQDEEVKKNVDDIVLWIYVYEGKNIDEINNKIEKIKPIYKNIKNNITNISLLENLCCTFLENITNWGDDNKQFKEYLLDILEYLTSDVNNEECIKLYDKVLELFKMYLSQGLIEYNIDENDENDKENDKYDIDTDGTYITNL